MSAFPRFFILLSVLVSQLAFGQATASLETPRQDETLPFVNETGFIPSALRVSDVVLELGAPESDRLTLVTVENGKRRGDDRVLVYSRRGITFLVEHDQRKATDPVISTMTVASPSVARTPAGLSVGMPESVAMPVVDRHYLVTHDLRSQGTGTINLTEKQSRSRRSAAITFKAGVLNTMVFTVADRPMFARPQIRTREVLLSLMILLGVAYVLARRMSGSAGSGPFGSEGRWLPAVLAPGSIWRTWLRHAIGLALVALGIVFVQIGRESMQSLIFLIMGFGFFFYAALVFAGSKNRVVSLIATALVAAVLVGSILLKFVR